MTDSTSKGSREEGDAIHSEEVSSDQKGSNEDSEEVAPRRIIHVDMDAFYAQM